MTVTGIGVGGSRGPAMTLASTSNDACPTAYAANDRRKSSGTDANGTEQHNPEKVREVVISEGEAGHLVPFEQVTRVAGEIASWIGAPKVRRRWAEDMEREKREWIGVSREEKRRQADGFLDWLRSDSGTNLVMRSKL